MHANAPPDAERVLARLRELGDPEEARFRQRYFRTGPGEYGEGDRFLGIRIPALRGLTRDFRDLPLPETVRLLRSEWHEARLLALLLLVRAYQRGDAELRERIYALYLENTRSIDNWDLVDLSAEHIVGAHLEGRSTDVLLELARSALLWERRIAMLATFFFLKRRRFDETLRVAEVLLHDREDLIHKAVGWMLREVGKRDPEAEEAFLRRHYRTMPRTMLRYAIERFPEPRRQAYLRGEV